MFLARKRGVTQALAQDLSMLRYTLLAEPCTLMKKVKPLVEIFRQIYENSDSHYEVYMACEAFLDLDEQLILWRSRHVMMVERMIGAMPGTGGSKGVLFTKNIKQTSLSRVMAS